MKFFRTRSGPLLNFTKRSVILLLTVCIFDSCATYYQKHLKFNNFFIQGKLQEAAEILAKDKKGPKRKDHVIYYLNRGTVASLQGLYEESNQYFEEAYKLVDSYHQNYLNEGVSFLLNPNIVEYKGEDFELLFIHYYKALNYLKLNQLQEALVECRRMNIRLNIINDKYSNDKRYRRDAFIHNLMGIIYEANKEMNHAFIAYRNAAEIYKQDYQPLLGVDIPSQLIHDLLRSAYVLGFTEELKYYEKEFNIKFKPSEKSESELIFLWQNGLGPVKSEFSINFTLVRGSGGNLTFVNEQMGLSFPFVISDDDYNGSGLSKLEFIRVAFPKYIERPLIFNHATLSINHKEYPLELAESINAIAFRSLQDRMLLELGKGLLRVALKKAAEYKMRSENQNAGALVGLFNAISEQADTRHWSTLPHSIYYTRVPVNAGKQVIRFTRKGMEENSNRTDSLVFDIKKGSTHFHTYHSLEVKNGPIE